jgi:hypothetical protein
MQISQDVLDDIAENGPPVDPNPPQGVFSVEEIQRWIAHANTGLVIAAKPKGKLAFTAFETFVVFGSALNFGIAVTQLPSVAGVIDLAMAGVLALMVVVRKIP